MLVHPQFDPVIVAVGPLAVRWYGMMYLVAFVGGWWLGRHRARRDTWRGWRVETVDDVLFYMVLGIIVGGRLGYVLFYKPGYYAANPLEALAVWKGGMAFHGGLLGVILALALFARLRQRPFLQVSDLVAPCVPTGIAAVRIGNFINGELWGRPADPSLPWAMVFPQSGSAVARHPSQIYQALGEGLLLFALLWIYSRRPRATGQVSGAFLIGYGSLRFVAEYFREPDAFLGLQALGLSRGQWLCVPMVLAGLAIWGWALRTRKG